MVTSFRVVGNVQPSEEERKSARKLYAQFKLLCSTTGVNTLHQFRRLTDTSYVTFRRVNKDLDIVSIWTDGNESMETPEPTNVTGWGLKIFCGLITKTIAVPEVVENPKTGVPEIVIAPDFYPEAIWEGIHKYGGGLHKEPKLGVEADQTEFNAAMIMAGALKKAKVTQGYCCHPTRYSGRMMGLVQYLLGIGKIGPHAFYPEDYFLDPLYTKHMGRMQANGYRIPYNYSYHRSHIIAVGPSSNPDFPNQLWVVQIDFNGIHAMPLQVFDPKKYALPSNEYWDQIKEEFNGIPTGVPFPLGKLLRKQVELGNIIELMSEAEFTASDYYKHSGYGDNYGWTCNRDGVELHNTSNYFHDDGIQRGVHWKLTLTIGAIKKTREKNEPIATGSATLYKVSEGKLFYAKGRLVGMPLKTYVDAGVYSGLYTYDAGIAREASGDYLKAKCDTTVMVAFVNEELHLIKYFKDTKMATQTIVKDEPDPNCNIDEHTKTTILTDSYIPAMMYTNYIDDRAMVAEHGLTIETQFSKLGAQAMQVGDFADSPNFFFVIRSWLIKQSSTVSITSGGKYISTQVVFPGYNRNAYYYAKREQNPATIDNTSESHFTKPDPNVSWGRRGLWGASYSVYVNGVSTPIPDMFDSVKKKDGTRRVTLLGPYSGGDECADKVSAGIFAPIGMIADNLPGPAAAPPPIGTQKNNPPTEKSEGYFYGGADGDRQKITIKSFYAWWIMSPHPDTGQIDQMFCTASTLGPSKQVVFASDINSPDYKTLGQCAILGLPKPETLGVYVGVV